MTQPWQRRLTDLGQELGRGLRQLLYPGLCLVCATPLQSDQGPFCATCFTALSHFAQPSCPRCAATVGPHAQVEDGCPLCRNERFLFERVVRLGPYEGLLRDVVLRLKQASGELLAEAIGDLWVARAEPSLRELRADAVVPVPLHWWRRLGRGYNQSEALALSLARGLGLPCRPRWLRRVRHALPQTLLPAAARREGLKGAFRARAVPGLQGRTILLVDDVLTTGSTCREAARALLRAGAARVVVAVLARGHP